MKIPILNVIFLSLLLAGNFLGDLTPMLEASSLGRYLGLGFRHILPEGLDHMCFVLGLFFAARQILPLFWQVTVFTLAHSLTFGLALYGLVEAPARLVEVVVALSITFIAVENVFLPGLAKWRLYVVFGFGLVHGLALAHTFQDQAVAPADLPLALLAFNVGIELAQLAVVGVALAVFGVWWRRGWYPRAIAAPALWVIGACGLFWAVARTMG